MTQPADPATPEILVPRAPLWVLSFAADGHSLSCAFVLLSEGYSFDDAWLRARNGGTVPPGRWDVVGWQVPEQKQLELLELDPDTLIGSLEPGQRLTEEQARRFFGDRAVWDWRAVDGPRRRALLEAERRAELAARAALKFDPCVHEVDAPEGTEPEHDTANTESCTVHHEGRGPCRMCRKCLRWIRWEELQQNRRPPLPGMLRT